MSQSVFGAAAAVTMLNRAFNNSSPANAVFNNQVATAGSTAEGQFAFANTFAASFNTLTDAQLAERVLGNMGVLPNDPLLAAVADYFTATGVASRGTVVLQLGQILAGLETATGEQAIYAPQAAAWNTEVEKSFIYSSNSANTTAYEGDFAPTPVGQGQTFTLTQNVDNIQGTNGDDTIIAGPGSAGGVHTLGASDVINGGTGNDKIIITSQAPAAGENLVPRITSVEQVLIQAVGAGNTTVNMINATGSKEVWSDNSTSTVFVSNLQEKATIGVKGGNGGNSMGVQAAAPALTGDLAVALNGANAAVLAVNATGLLGAAGYTSTTINTTVGNDAITGRAGTQTSQLALLDVGNALNKVTVTGDGAVRVGADLAATVRTIDASANKGGVNFNIANNTGNVTFTGGDGNDRINFGVTLNLQDKVDGGAGRDILGVTDQSFIIPGLQVSNVEVLELNTLNATLNAALIAGVDEVRVTTTLNNGTVNGLTSNSTFVTNAAGNATLNLVNAQVAGTNDTLNLKTGLTANGAVNVMAGGVENIVYTDNVTANTGRVTTVNFFDTDGVVDVTNLTLAGNAGNTVNFNGLVNTIRTVDGSASMGSTNVSIAAGNPTNGVTIKGGAQASVLTGGDGKDVITGGAGNDRISGGDYLVPAVPTADKATYDLSGLTVKIGDTASVTIDGVPYTATATAANPANLAALLAAQIAAGANPFVGSVEVVGNQVVVTAATTGNGSNFGGGVSSLTHVTDPAAVSLNAPFNTIVPAANATKALTTVTFNSTSGNFAINDVIAYTFADADGTSVLVSYTVVAADIVLDGPTTAANIANKFVAAIAAAAPPADQVTAVRTGNEVKITSTTAGMTVMDSSVSLTADGTNTATGVTVVENSNGTDATQQTVTVDFTGFTYAVGDKVTLSWNDGAVQSVTHTVVAGGTSATAVASALDALFVVGTSNVTNAGGVVTIQDTSLAGAAATITAVSTTIDRAPITSSPVVPTIVQGVNGVATSVAASDTLAGAAGNDVFVFGGQSGGWNGTTLANMDTITDLNLGGASGATSVDTIQLSSAVLGYGAFNASSLVNAGGAVTITGPTFNAALQGLFNAGGALAGATNNVGLFTYGADTYLIAANSTLGLDANDIVIKVTGATGTLDLSDIAIV
jgi:hypothetical protein